MYCRMYRKVNGLSKDSQGRNIKILHSDMPVFKNAKWPTCVYVIKNITQTVVIYSKSRYDGRKQEYPTEPLDKIPALQGRIALAGKLNIGHMHLLENIYKHYTGWEFMLKRWL